MEVKVNEQDLRAVIAKQSAEIASKDLSIAALGRTLQQMEMAHAAEESESSEDSPPRNGAGTASNAETEGTVRRNRKRESSAAG